MNIDNPTADIQENNIDDNVDNEIFSCLNISDPKSFFLFAGAGSGKTRSLVNVLRKVRAESGSILTRNRQKIAVITYTNAACNEIKNRLDQDPLFSVSTIHSFIWELIRNYQEDIRAWVKNDISKDILDLQDKQQRGRTGKASTDRAREIETKTSKLENLNEIRQFTYNPNGDNRTRESLNHSEVINIGAYFLTSKPLMQNILVRKFPMLLIDESQDTKKELIDAFFAVQKENSKIFSLGLFGDTMQRIYSDGKQNLGQELPADWIKPVKKMNHRSPKRIIELINKIRSSVDNQDQLPNTSKVEGIVRLFIVPSLSEDKASIETRISNKMAQVTGDKSWNESAEIKILTLEHHMAARRMGFLELFLPLYSLDRFKTGLMDGSLPGIRLFTQMVLPLVNAKFSNNEFEVARIVKQHSPLFDKETFQKSTDQIEIIRKSNEGVNSLISLWKEETPPTLIEILKNLNETGLFSIPDQLSAIAKRSNQEQEIAEFQMDNIEGDEPDESIDVWDKALSAPFTQIEAYYEYISDKARFSTHQGVKGLEFHRIIVILDDEEARGFMFSYEKLFGAKDQSDGDIKNIQEGKETSNDRTLRLFYVACSRAEKSLAIIVYTKNPALVEKHVLKEGWFQKEEIEII